MAGWYFPPTGLPFIPIHPRFFLSSSCHYAPIFAIICDFCPHLLAGKQPREQIQELFLFDPVAKLPINMNLLLTKKWKGTSLQNEHPLPSPYFLEKNASLFLSFHRVHASFFLLFFLFFCYISRLLQHHPTRLPFSPLAVCFLNPTCRFFMTLSQFHSPPPPSIVLHSRISGLPQACLPSPSLPFHPQPILPFPHLSRRHGII